MLNSLFAVTMLGLALSFTATSTAKAERYALKTCIVSGESLEDNVPVTYKGKTYQLCCKSCAKKFNANPEKYVAVFNKQAKAS